MKPIGGYFSLETNAGQEYHCNALRFNAGRYALEFILITRKYRKIYLPYYICDSVMEPIRQLGIEYDFYHINNQLEPAVSLQPKDDEVVLYVNYFGLKDSFAETFCYNYSNTILDFTQAFYCHPGNKYNNRDLKCDTFYSCRKYFGVPDGAYLYTDAESSVYEKISQDESFERMTFLTKRIDRSPQEAYPDFHANDEAIGDAGMLRMSRLTESILSGIDYTAKANRRIHNFYMLNDALNKTNNLKLHLDYGTVPLVYPYYVKDGARLRQHLIDHQVFCARYWPNVMDWCQPCDLEYQLAENLVCLPIDQRYDDSDMERILKFLL